MSQPSWFDRTPQWVWYACVPVLGGGAIAYAGSRTKSKIWMGIGAGFVTLGVILYSVPWLSAFAWIVWMAQIGAAFLLKREYLIKTFPKNHLLPDDPKLLAAIARHRPKIDINTCSKNDLVNVLGLPIVYANDIDSLKAEGFIFTSIDDLHDILEIPNATLNKISPMVAFSYDYRQEAGYSWKRINSMSAEDLMVLGLEPKVAQALAAERENRGEYKSVMDIKKRTGIPFSAFSQLV
jgi:DNA uptake protein ComE-like DNA-binding protein